MKSHLLQLKNISKDYAGNRVLKNVSLDIEEGEIHALIGENGAGKSTLMNILFGMPVIFGSGGFEGEICFNGENVRIDKPQDAMDLGIGMVHQEFMLVPGFTVTENVRLNREMTRPNLVSGLVGKKYETLDVPRMRSDVRAVLDMLNFSLDETELVERLPVSYMQFVEIARELDKPRIRLLVLDEPTAVLGESEADILLKSMKNLRDKGMSILFITHRLAEVRSVADRVTILRDGEVVAALPAAETNIDRLAELMVGRNLALTMDSRNSSLRETDNLSLKIESLEVRMPGEHVKSLDLEVFKGEILGLGGLAGQGKVGVANGVMGLCEASGKVYRDGKPLPLNDPLNALSQGMAFVSEDRRGVGLLLDQSIEMNIAIKAMQARGKFLNGLRVDYRAMRAHALEMIEKLDIRCTGPGQNTRYLSGGNQQKVCIAGALTLEPDLLFVSEPTRGIDVGAKKLVLDLLRVLNRERQMTIVMTSSELGELRSICHRIAIVYNGSVIGILPPDASDREFGLMMAGELQYGNEVA
ncbi:MAG: sugar ABC transporter ATP-binding protein [Synergistaceae bacterium]|jgi:simple sugar transport system ATP-binding protein|nr:sugar ABC transporter ATP-binding protein [Synergistaceae bacterium]